MAPCIQNNTYREDNFNHVQYFNGLCFGMFIALKDGEEKIMQIKMKGMKLYEKKS